MANVRITHVGDVTNQRKDGTPILGNNGEPRSFFEVRVAGEHGLIDIEARRNFWVENKHTLNRERAVRAMQSGTNVSESIEIVTVDIEPMPMSGPDGNPLTDREGNTLFVKTVRVLKMAGETIDQALRATYPNAKRKGVFVSTETGEVAEEELAGVAM